MSITIAIVIAAITLFLGEVAKLFKVNTRFIPLQNIIIAILSTVVCIIFNVQSLSILETALTCIFATLGAGGAYDLIASSAKRKGKSIQG